MIISTTPNIEGKQVSQVLGIARGNTVRSRNVARDIFAALKNVVGGEIDEYTKLQAQSREQAISRMKDDAKSLGADIIMMMPPYHGALLKGNEVQIYEQFDEISKVGIPIMIQDAPLSGIELTVPLPVSYTHLTLPTNREV